MNVSLGTLEVTDDERKQIGGGKLATREQVREFCFDILIDRFTELGVDRWRGKRQTAAAKRRAAGKFTEFEKALRKRR